MITKILKNFPSGIMVEKGMESPLGVFCTEKGPGLERRDFWYQNRHLGGRAFRVTGFGREPTSSQVEIFYSIDANICDLIRDSEGIIRDSSEAEFSVYRKDLLRRSRRENKIEVDLRVDPIGLSEIKIEDGKTSFLMFDTPASREIHSYPVVFLNGLDIQKVEWWT